MMLVLMRHRAMTLNNKVIIDIETDNLYPDATTIYCIVCKELDSGKVLTFTNNNYDSFIDYCKFVTTKEINQYKN